MRGVVISCVIAVMIVAGSLWYTHKIEKISEELAGINDKARQCLYVDDFDGAKVQIERLTECMEENRTMLAATGNHEDFDKIEMNISEALGYVTGYEKTDAISHCNVLGFLLEHLPKNYRLRLENIL